MPDTSYDELLANVMRNLERHGYPQVRVSLPLERMYEVAHEKGLNFNKALELLRERGVDHEKTADKIIFTPVVEMPGSISPDMMAQALEMLKNMSAEERQQLENMVANMSDGDKEDMLRKAKELGLL